MPRHHEGEGIRKAKVMVGNKNGMVGTDQQGLGLRKKKILNSRDV